MARAGLTTKAVYMTEQLKEFWAELKTRWPYTEMKDTAIIAKLIEQEVTQSRDAVNLDPMALADIDFLLQKMSERSGRVMTRSAVVREVARDKAAEYDARQNNAARITNIVERLGALEVLIQSLVNQSNPAKQIEALQAAVTELAGLLKAEKRADQ